MKIPNEMSRQFFTVAGRKALIQQYGEAKTVFSGQNDDGERVCISFHREYGIALTTYQHNGWCRENYYDKNGHPSGETYSGKWTV